MMKQEWGRMNGMHIWNEMRRTERWRGRLNTSGGIRRHRADTPVSERRLEWVLRESEANWTCGANSKRRARELVRWRRKTEHTDTQGPAWHFHTRGTQTFCGPAHLKRESWAWCTLVWAFCRRCRCNRAQTRKWAAAYHIFESRV